MALKLQSFSIQHQMNPVTIFAGVVNEKNESANVQIPLHGHHNVNALTIGEVENMAIAEAHRFAQGA